MAMSSEPLVRLEAKVAPVHTAVVVIDLQNDFVDPRGGLAQLGTDLRPIQAIVPRVSRLLGAARKAGVTVIFIRHVNSDETTSAPILEKRRGLGREEVRVCWKGTWGAEICGELAPHPTDLVLEKPRYSAFINTPLDSILRAREIRTLVIVGMSTNVCVESTSRDGFMRDFFVVIPADCVASSVPDAHGPALDNLARYFATLTTEEAIERCWDMGLAGERLTLGHLTFCGG
jgi:ureidoacrylate peracid hydrolase